MRTAPSASISGLQRGWNDIVIERPVSMAITSPSAAMLPSG